MRIIPYGMERFSSERFRSFRKTRVHQASGSAAEIETDLAVLRSFEARAKARRLILLLVALLIAGVTVLAAGNARGDDQGIIAVVGGVVFVIFMIIRLRQPKHFETRRVELASGLLRGLRVGAEPCTLELDVAPIMARRKKAGRQNGFDVYNDPFLKLEVPLVDGTRLKIERSEQLQYYELRTAKRHVREWKGTEWDTITITAPAGQAEYRGKPPHDFSRLNANVLTLLSGFEGVSFEARPNEVRVVVKNQLLWDAAPDGKVQDKRDDAVRTILLWVQQLAVAGQLGALTAHPPQEAWKVKLPVVGLRGGVVLLALCAIAGFGLTAISGSEMPQHYAYIDEYGASSFEEDVIRTSAFGFVCCALPLAACFGLVALGRKRRRRYEG